MENGVHIKHVLIQLPVLHFNWPCAGNLKKREQQRQQKPKPKHINAF